MEGMIRRVNNGTQSERYFYDPHRRRFLSIREDGTWRFSLGNDYEMIVSGRQVAKRAYVIESNQIVARLDVETSFPEPPTQSLELIHQDRRGDVLIAMDDMGNLKGHYVYGAFGESLWAAGDVSDLRRGFDGKELDRISGLFYYGYRCYDPFIIRWTSADPVYRYAPDVDLGNPQRLNLYAFRLNSPEPYLDETGLNAGNSDEFVPSYSDEEETTGLLTLRQAFGLSESPSDAVSNKEPTTASGLAESQNYVAVDVAVSRGQIHFESEALAAAYDEAKAASPEFAKLAAALESNRNPYSIGVTDKVEGFYWRLWIEGGATLNLVQGPPEPVIGVRIAMDLVEATFIERGEPPPDLASALAHELTHAYSWINRGKTFNRALNSAL
jgi:RHS repeat-associated protein